MSAICPICDGRVHEYLFDGYTQKICTEGHFEVRQGFMGAHIRYADNTFFFHGGRDNGFIHFIATVALDEARRHWFNYSIYNHNWKKEGF